MDHPLPETCSCSALRQASRHLTRFYDEVLAPTELGLNQFSVMAKIDRHGEMSVQELAGLLVMDRSTSGHIMRPLEKGGILPLRASEQDGRKRVVALTPYVTTLLGTVKELWKFAENRFQERFGKKEAARLRTMTRSVTVVELHNGTMTDPSFA